MPMTTSAFSPLEVDKDVHPVVDLRDLKPAEQLFYLSKFDACSVAGAERDAPARIDSRRYKLSVDLCSQTACVSR